MSIPVVQAGAEQAWPYASLPKSVTLSGDASNSPILWWKWTMLYVPPGSSANVGVNGNFVNGIATIQNPSFTCDVDGCYVLQLQARNVDGWSDPLSDRDVCQTPVYILSELYGIRRPGRFLWLYDVDLNQTLSDLEEAIASGGVDTDAFHKSAAGEISSLAEKDPPVSNDVILIEDSADGGNKKKVRMSSLPGGTDTTALHKATAAEISAMTEKTTPVGADILVLEDSAAGYVKKKVQFSKLSGVDTTALHKATAGEIAVMTNKILPVDADMLVIEDSEDASAKKRMSIGNLPIGSDRWQAYRQDTEYSLAGTSFTEQFSFRVSRDSNKKVIGWRVRVSTWAIGTYGGRSEVRVRAVGSGGTDQVTIYSDAGSTEKVYGADIVISETNEPEDTPITIHVDLRIDTSGDTSYMQLFEFFAIIDTSGGGYGSGGGGG